jgi:hypothetical protein
MAASGFAAITAAAVVGLGEDEVGAVAIELVGLELRKGFGSGSIRREAFTIFGGRRHSLLSLGLSRRANGRGQRAAENWVEAEGALAFCCE